MVEPDDVEKGWVTNLAHSRDVCSCTMYLSAPTCCYGICGCSGHRVICRSGACGWTHEAMKRRRWGPTTMIALILLRHSGIVLDDFANAIGRIQVCGFMLCRFCKTGVRAHWGGRDLQCPLLPQHTSPTLGIIEDRTYDHDHPNPGVDDDGDYHPLQFLRSAAAVATTPSMLKNWTLLGAIISCSVHPRENHSGQPSDLGYTSLSRLVGMEGPWSSWRYA